MRTIILLTALLMAMPCTNALSMECSAREGWPFFPTEEDMQTFGDIVQAKDAAAEKKMQAMKRVYYFKAGIKVQRTSGFSVCKFRVPGTTLYAFTYCEALENCR